MTPGDVARVLTAAAARDGRTIGDADVLAWHQDIGDLEYADALEAVSRHYQHTTDRLMPAHLRQLAGDIDRERRRAAREAAELEAKQRAAIDRGPTRDRSAEVTALVRQVIEQLPGDPSDRIHERARLRARRDNGRPDTKPRSKPGKSNPTADYPPPQDDRIAALASRYLLDGYPPATVAEKLAVSKRWCRRHLARLQRREPEPQP